MAQVEPMDIDDIENDFDNKENSSHHSNVLPCTPCMEKGYEELDVSELNMKLRYSLTPATSPMSRSLNDYENNTANAVASEPNNLTRSLNSTITKSETINSLKLVPLQVITSNKVIDDRDQSVLRTKQSDSDTNNVTVTLEGGTDNDENMSLPSTSSSVTHTPEATTPTKEIPKHDGSSPILRGLKSVLNMFRSSQSPIPPSETTFTNVKQEILSPNDSILKDMQNNRSQTVVVSTPIANNRKASSESRRSSPLKESIVFNEDLEKDLQWKDETTIFFKDEKIPLHKLFPSQSLCNSKSSKIVAKSSTMDKSESKNVTEEYMSMSNNGSICQSGNAINQIHSLQNDVSALESDGEFVDCEMTLNGESYYSKLAEQEVDVNEISRNDNKGVHENTKQVIDNIEDLLTDCEENKSYVIQKSSELTNDESTTVNSDHIISLDSNANNQKEFESKTNFVYESQSTCEKVVDTNLNMNETFASNIEKVHNELSAEEQSDLTNVTLCEDNVKKCNLNNDYNEIVHPNEVPLPDDNNVDFMEFPNTTKDNEMIIESKMCMVQQDLNETAMSVNYSDSVVAQESNCQQVHDVYEMKVNQHNNQETTNLKISVNADEPVTKETTPQAVDLYEQGDCLKSQIIKSVDTPIDACLKPVIMEMTDNKNLLSNVHCELANEDDKNPSEYNSENKHSGTSMYGKDDLLTNPVSLNNCEMLHTTTYEQNTSDKADETIVIESNNKECIISNKLTNYDNTHLNEINDCATNTTFNMDANIGVKLENVVETNEIKTHEETKVMKNTAISDLVESSDKCEDVFKEKNNKLGTILNSVADEENVNIKDISLSVHVNQEESFINNERSISNSTDILLPKENEVKVSDILNEKSEEFKLERCLTTSLDSMHKTSISPEFPPNLPDQDTFVETIEVFACHTEKTDSKTAMNTQDVSLERFATNSSSHEHENDGIIDTSNKSSVRSSESKNVFNLPEMSSAFVSKMKENALDANNGSKHVFKIPSSNLPNLSAKCDSNAQDVDHKLCLDKNELDSSDVSTSSKASEATVHEVNTEDDDTVEASFFETEDFNDVDKKSDLEDMIDFSDIPAQKINNNVYKGEMFIDAEAFQFLLNQNKSNVVADSGRESLFLKFDPLFAKRMSTDAAAVSKIQKGQSTPKRMSKALSNIEFYRNANETTESTLEANFEDATVLLSKPMMVVNPAVNSVFSPRNKSCTPPRANRRSHTFTSPAIAVIDRLLSLSGDNSALNLEMSMNDVRGRTNETDQVLTQLRELLAEKEINVHGLRSESKELSERLRTLESQVKTLETESEQRLRKVDDLNKCLAEKTKMNKGMAVVVEEYERTIASLTAEIEQDKKAHAEERMKLINERNEQNAHLASMTMSFNDLHSKYEKNKQIILNCKDNEEKYIRSIKEFDESVIKIQNNYELLKQHATSNLNNKNDEFEKLNRTHEAEVLKYGAMIKRKEMDISSLKETLAQKIKANEELTAICDELLNKVA